MIRLARRWPARLALGCALAGLIWAMSAAFRAPLFEWFAAGSRWVLVACGFESPGAAQSAGAERLRRLYYAARMFREVPPARLSADDAWADARYPGMGFGLLRTFDQYPVRVVVGGWRYLIPCAYFADARDCRRGAPGSARLRLWVEDFGPLRPAYVAEFLAVSSPAVMRVMVVAADQGPAQWWLEDLRAVPAQPASPLPGFVAYPSPESGYQVYRPLQGDDGAVQLRCNLASTDPAIGVWQHCRDRFTVGAGALVEVHFAAVHAPAWQRLRAGVRQRFAQFRGETPGPAVIQEPAAGR